jgi:predicted Zn-dependent peptidase
MTAPTRSADGTIQVDRSRLPDVRPADRFRFPRLEKSALSNGLRVWTSQHTSIPVVALMLIVNRGSGADPVGGEGLAAMTVDMLDEGSDGLSAIEVHQALSRIGAQLDSEIGPDGAALALTCLSRFTEPALSLLGAMAGRPALSEADFERVRDLRLNRLLQLRDVPGAVADRTFARLLYGAHPYGHTPLGAEPALRAMTIDDVRRFHEAFVRPAAATLVVVGDCRHDDVLRAAEAAFAGWTGAAEPQGSVRFDLPDPPRVNVVPRPGAPQSELRIGHVSAARNTPDYHALVAANMVLGGQFVSRINLNLREEKGFTYGARTSFDFRREPGPFALQVSVQTRATAAAIEESLREIADIRGARPITSDELALGIAALTRGFPRNFETAEQVARAILQLVLYDLPDTYFQDFVPSVERLMADDVTAVAARYLDPDRMTTLIVGDLDAIREDVASLKLGVPVTLSAESF